MSLKLYLIYLERYLHLIGIFFIALLLGCSNAHKKEDRPNIVWINVEDINPVLGCYGDPHAITPNLDKLASEGVIYKRAYSTAPICAPSRSSFVTGVYSTSLGTQHLRSRVEKPDYIKTLPEYLKSEGYYVTNFGKTDWNFSPEGIFDYWEHDLSPWKNRPEGMPFFSTFVIGGTHEGSVNKAEKYKRITSDLPSERFQDPSKNKRTSFLS